MELFLRVKLLEVRVRKNVYNETQVNLWQATRIGSVTGSVTGSVDIVKLR